MAIIRGSTILWNNVATGVAPGKSATAYVGSDINVVLFVKTGGATTFTIEAALGTGAPGLNSVLLSTDWFPLYKRDGSGALTLTFAGSGSAAVDLSPYAAQYIRLSSSNNITATASIDVVG